MTNITEDYVSFEVAKLLKEKGFDIYCPTAYETMTFEHHVEEPAFSDWGKLGQVKRPTLQMAMKWLREVHNICISVDVKIGGGKYYVCISSTESGLSHGALEDEVWDTFEKACEAAIKYCLENLI